MMTYLRMTPPFHMPGSPARVAPVLHLPRVVERVPDDAPGRVAGGPALGHRRGPVAGAGQHGTDLAPQCRDRGGVADGWLPVPDSQLACVRGVRAEHMIDDLFAVPATPARALPQVRGRRAGDLVEHLPCRAGEGSHPPCGARVDRGGVTARDLRGGTEIGPER